MAKAMALHPVATSVTGLGASLETTHNLFSMFRRFSVSDVTTIPVT